MSLFQIRLKFNEYFDSLVNSVDIKAETLLEQFKRKSEKIDEINSQRAKFIEAIDKCRQVNLDYLESSQKSSEFYLEHVLDSNDELSENSFKENCFFLNSFDDSFENFSLGLLLIINTKYASIGNLTISSLKSFFTDLKHSSNDYWYKNFNADLLVSYFTFNIDNKVK